MTRAPYRLLQTTYQLYTTRELQRLSGELFVFIVVDYKIYSRRQMDRDRRRERTSIRLPVSLTNRPNFQCQFFAHIFASNVSIHITYISRQD